MIKRWLLVAPGIALLMLILNSAWGLVRSEVWRSQTENFLDYWTSQTKKDSNYVLDKKDWDTTLEGADEALKSMPNSPDLLVMRAKVLDRGVPYGWSDSENSSPMELNAWQQAIIQRPAWPYSWSDYAIARSQRSLIDSSFKNALIRADQVGPWEQRVMENATTLGGYYRGWLSGSLQQTLDASQERLSKLYPRRAKQLEKLYPLP